MHHKGKMVKKLFAILLLSALTGCSFLTTKPDQLSQQERFKQLGNTQAPVQGKVRIYWNEYSIPYIQTQHDEDLAFALGVVHAHLRIDQIGLYRMISQGRLSEIAGPIPQVKMVDHGLRIMDLDGSARRTWEVMSPESKAWMQEFTRGINWYIAGLKQQPVTNQLMDQPLKPFTVMDILTISKLASADLTWGTYLKYLKQAEKEDWQEVFAYSLQKLKSDSATFDNVSDGGFAQLLKSVTRSGSNSVVVAGHKTTSGSAMIANDPHVGLMLPNFWLLAGVKSPSYHVVGMMIPGVPIFGIGRNEHISWGGTNMRGISSHLFDVSNLDEHEIQIRKETIQRRWWFDSTIEVRDTPYGPILTDLEYFDRDKLPFEVAIDWVGRKGTDELKTFLQLAQAQNWNDFQQAFAGYQVSAMNMVYADDQGNIGMVAAYGQPVLKHPAETLKLVKSINNPIQSVRLPTEHPNPYNPKSGVIASANNKPFQHPEIPFAFSYAINDRVERLKELTYGRDNISLEDLKRLQQDVYSTQAHQIAQLLDQRLPETSKLRSDPDFQTVLGWNGEYQSDSRGALVFYAVMVAAWSEYVQELPVSGALKEALATTENWKPSMLTWLREKPADELEALMSAALLDSAAVIGQHATWGDFMTQSQTTPFGMIPVLGASFKLADYPLSGSNDTLNKYGKPFSNKPGKAHYGASARHVSDMSKPDENYFVLHGGQDSWIMNENLADQTPLWRKGQYIQMPLSMHKVKDQFNRHITLLSPSER